MNFAAAPAPRIVLDRELQGAFRDEGRGRLPRVVPGLQPEGLLVRVRGGDVRHGHDGQLATEHAAADHLDARVRRLRDFLQQPHRAGARIRRLIASQMESRSARNFSVPISLSPRHRGTTLAPAANGFFYRRSTCIGINSGLRRYRPGSRRVDRGGRRGCCPREENHAAVVAQHPVATGRWRNGFSFIHPPPRRHCCKQAHRAERGGWAQGLAQENAGEDDRGRQRVAHARKEGRGSGATPPRST